MTEMKILICNSKNWFELDKKILNKCEVVNITDKDDLNQKILNKFKPDFIFFPHWNWVVSEKIFLNYKCIVFHTSPLPYGRGGSPIQNLIVQGYKEAPVCAIKMEKNLDSGPIYYKEIVSLSGSLFEILDRINVVVNNLIIRLINNLPVPQPQIGEVVAFKRLGIKDNQININSKIEKFYDHIRMLDDNSYPSAYLILKNVVLHFDKIRKMKEEFECRVRISKRADNE